MSDWLKKYSDITFSRLVFTVLDGWTGGHRVLYTHTCFVFKDLMRCVLGLIIFHAFLAVLIIQHSFGTYFL